jgi:8-oxo-dGTP diphosphatase
MSTHTLAQPLARPAGQSTTKVRRGVVGVIRRGDRLLMIRRAGEVAKGGCWCFPGGHVEAGETPRRAVIRELTEELGIVVEPMTRLGAVRVMDSRHVLVVWQVRYGGGALRPQEREIADVRWMTPDAIRTVERGLPSNERVLGMLSL